MKASKFYDLTDHPGYPLLLNTKARIYLVDLKIQQPKQFFILYSL